MEQQATSADDQEADQKQRAMTEIKQDLKGEMKVSAEPEEKELESGSVEDS